MNDPDQDLVHRLQAGVGAEFEQAYQELYALYKDRVYTICLRVTGSEDDALDAAQETLITLARRIKDFAFRSRFSSWVYRIAVNAAIDIRRRRLDAPRGSVTTILGGAEGDPALDTSPDSDVDDPAFRVAGTESRAMILEALDRINPRFRAILTLRYMQGLSYEEIAEVEECNLGTVKSRLNRAHAALREHLTRMGGADLAGS